jgi:hypothetical protein
MHLAPSLYNKAKCSMDAAAAFPAFVELNRGTWTGTFYVSRTGFTNHGYDSISENTNAG